MTDIGEPRGAHNFKKARNDETWPSNTPFPQINSTNRRKMETFF